MKLKLARPLAFFDIESTGANWKTDRIIDLAVIVLHPDGRREERVFRVNPGIPIPRAATAVHGIGDDDVKDAPLFAAAADGIEKVFEGCDLAGYNLIRFDIPLLQEEFKRANRTFPMQGRRVIDAQRIFHKREPRDLTAALFFYRGEVHEGAHGAAADTEATLRVLEGQLERYPDLPAEVEALSDYCSPPRPEQIDREGKLVWDADGEPVLNFGKYRGRKLREVMVEERVYLEWMLRKNFAPEVDEIVARLLRGEAVARPLPAPSGEPA